MQSLTQDQKDRAQIYKLMKDPAMPSGAGFFRISAISAAAYFDNRVIAYEGVLARK